MSKRGFLGIVIVLGVGALLLFLTKCGYDKLEQIQREKASEEASVG